MLERVFSKTLKYVLFCNVYIYASMNIGKQSWLIDIASLLFFIILTIVAIVMKQITVFYVIYVFWWEEVIKTICNSLRYLIKKEQVRDFVNYKGYVSQRFFVLFVMFGFIFLCFGLMNNEDNPENLAQNIQIVKFQNIYFNISLVSIIVREVYVFNNKNLPIHLVPNNALSTGLFILFSSITMGILFWALLQKNIDLIPHSLEKYIIYAEVVPFLLIKFLFDKSAIKSKMKS